MQTSDEGLASHATEPHSSNHSSLQRFFSLHPEEFEFWRQQVGIKKAEDLEQHLLKIQREACAVLPYGCIRQFSFLRIWVTGIPGYDRLVKLGTEREGAVLLDVGCCFGTDIRKVAADGWPADSILATDIEPKFWELGHRLFCSTAGTFPAIFLQGDIFDPTHLDVDPAPESNGRSTIPPLRSLTSLNPLRGHVAAIHAGAFFHLFSEERQTALARAMASLLSPEPGSMILGWHAGALHKGVRVIARAPDHIPRAISSSSSPAPVTATVRGSPFCHSPES